MTILCLGPVDSKKNIDTDLDINTQRDHRPADYLVTGESAGPELTLKGNRKQYRKAHEER